MIPTRWYKLIAFNLNPQPMATLIVEHQGKLRGGMLNGRVVIGRRPGSNVFIDDKSVSRVHAWVGRVGQTYFVADGGSRTGTIVNGRPVEGRRTLRDGDEILIGPAKLFFHTDAPLPPGIEPLTSGNDPSSDEEGSVVECKCGTPTWVEWNASEASCRCVHCGRTITVPHRPGSAVSQSPQPRSAEIPSAARQSEPRILAQEPPGRSVSSESSTQETTCGACQSPIGPNEQTTSCPECGVSFHANCWLENRGCSSYGCKQVGILDPRGPAVGKPAASATAPTTPQADFSPHNPRQVQWSYVLLPLSGLAGLAGLFAFGVPSLALLVGLIFYRLRRPVRSQWVFAVAEGFSAIAAAAGSAFSTYWWLLPAAGMVHR